MLTKLAASYFSQKVQAYIFSHSFLQSIQYKHNVFSLASRHQSEICSLFALQSRDCAQLGPPEVGEAVQVKWPDGLFYGAKYLGSNTSYMYQVHTLIVIFSLVLLLCSYQSNCSWCILCSCL